MTPVACTRHDGKNRWTEFFYPILLYVADQLEEGCNQQGKLI
jgi:hypothetical protein